MPWSSNLVYAATCNGKALRANEGLVTREGQGKRFGATLS